MARVRSGDRFEVAVLVACLIVSVLLFAFAQTQAGRVLTRVELALLWPADAVRGFFEGVVGERRENERLKQELAVLRQQQMLWNREQVDEGPGVERTPEVPRLHAAGLHPARVLGTSGEPWPLVYHLSAGSRDGVAVGQPVISPEGLVGRIEVVDGRTSSAALITDPLLAVACEVVPGGVRGVLRFRLSGRPGLYLEHVPLTDTVHVGEQVASSGMSQRFPSGILIGTIVRLGLDPGGLVQEIQVNPAAPLSRLREVLILTDSTQWVAPLFPRVNR